MYFCRRSSKGCFNSGCHEEEPVPRDTLNSKDVSSSSLEGLFSRKKSSHAHEENKVSSDDVTVLPDHVGSIIMLVQPNKVKKEQNKNKRCWLLTCFKFFDSNSSPSEKPLDVNDITVSNRSIGTQTCSYIIEPERNSPVKITVTEQERPKGVPLSRLGDIPNVISTSNTNYFRRGYHRYSKSKWELNPSEGVLQVGEDTDGVLQSKNIQHCE